MNYSTYKNPLYNWWKSTIHRAKQKNTTVHPEWTTWFGFAKWADEHGYDENSKLKASVLNPFTPEYLGTTRCEDRDCEYIAYEASDPYELIIASASYVEELSEKLMRMGYTYTPESIMSALARNGERAVDDRIFGLIFEKIDLSNYNEDDEPFETKENA
jgi:hypothetical protein